MTNSYAPPYAFISYSSHDSKFVTQLVTDLQAQGINIWIDREGLQPGIPNWREALRQAICAAQAVLFVASPNSRYSSFVLDELDVAVSYNRPVFPIWSAGSKWIDSVPLGYGTFQYIDARESLYATAVSKVVRELKKIITSPPPRRPPPPPFIPRNPYKGLHAFTGNDSRDFFGRKALIDELADALEETLTIEKKSNEGARLLAVVGPSGSGKSSVVMAGLLPYLQNGGVFGSKEWIYLDPIVPGKRPIESLALMLKQKLGYESLTPIMKDLMDESARGLLWLASSLVKQPEGKVVLFVDQFEELFTQTTSEDERQQFINLLMAAATEHSGPAILILTLRADFYDRPIQYPELGELLKEHHKLLLPMEIKGLREAVEGPAALPDVQLSFEGDLVGDLLFEVRGEVGALPLLQFTLDQLFQRRIEHQLTLRAYHEIGGVKGALSKHAEETYQELPSDEHRQMAREVFLRLFEPGTTEQDTTRRRAGRSEFTRADPRQAQQMLETLEALIRERLLTTNQITVEVIHEELIRQWERLAGWLREARDDILFQQSLSEDVMEWMQRKGQMKRSRDLLYRGAQLKEAQEWAKRNTPSELEMIFLRASTARRNLSLMSLIVVVLLLVSSMGVAGWFYLTQPPSPTLITTLQDNMNGSLRYCINNAPSGSTITFAQGLRGTIKLIGSLEVVSGKQLTIRGPGEDHIIISSGSTDSNIHVSKGARLDISDLSFKNSETVHDAFLFNEGTFTLTNSIIRNNKTTAGGTIFIGSVSSGGNSLGGGIENKGSLTVINSIISNNSAISIPGDALGGGIENLGQLTVIHSTFSNNSASSQGENSSGHSGSSFGGGIDNYGQLTVTSSTFLNNSVGPSSSGGESVGGGIFNHSHGTLTVTSSTFWNNSASSSSSGANGGGGIGNDGQLTVTSSTFSNNSASSGYGGAIWFSGTDDTSAAIIHFCTIYGNSSSVGGGISVDPTGSGHMTIGSSIVAANRIRPNTAPDGPDISGPLISDGYNRIGNVAGANVQYATTDRQVTYDGLKIDPTLRNNGGPTWTLALLPGSPAIDIIPRQACSITFTGVSGHIVTIITDQRGDRRPDGSENACDIGAYESSY